MSVLKSIQKGKTALPPRIIIYGTEGIGKSTVGSQCPNPIFIQTEDGIGQIDTSSFPKCETWDEFDSQLEALCKDDHDFGSVVIDSLDRLEALVWQKVCKDSNVDSIEKACGGYGKGYSFALTHWSGILDRLDYLRKEKNMVIMLIAHSKVEKFEDPVNGNYDRYSPRLNKHASAMVSEWSDAILFATRKMIVKQSDGGFNKKIKTAESITVEGSDRILCCEGKPACVAKNRFGIKGEIQLSWAALCTAMGGNK